MSFDSISAGATGCFPRRAHTINATDDAHTHTVAVYMHSFNPDCENDTVHLEVHKRCTTEELIEKVLAGRAELEGQSVQDFDLFEMMGTPDGQTYKERRLDPGEYPVAVQAIWSRLPVVVDSATPKNRFVFRHRGYRAATGGTRFGSAEVASSIDAFLTKFLVQPQDREYADLCNLPELTEQTLLDNLRERFANGHIYTYIGPILVAVNPFCFFPIYNPKYARLYFQSKRLGSLPPHIFAIADVCYHNMLRIKENQCVVISGESGSGKTESTNHLMSHLISLSQKGSTGCSTEQTLLSAGPVLEAFGNAVTLTNNNSSRFGKFIKINYRENGMVSGANVEIYLLEKSRIIFQTKGERNYHVFYYLLEGADEEERKKYFLLKPHDYKYLNQNEPFALEGVNERNEFDRLRHAMSSVGFCAKTQQTIFGIISAVLLLGNITYIKRHGYHSDESGYIENEEVVDLVANLLHIKTDTLMQALTMKRHVMKTETVVLRYSVSEATNTRDAMAKCIYNSLFHYIVLRINQALLKKDFSAGKGYYIGILDIFGFEDVGSQCNSFEQLCINYANEKLQSYFNQHIFQFEQEEYLKEGISWTNIEYTDNTECVQLFQSKPYGILRLVDEESNINNGTDDSMLAKLNQFLKNNEYYETPQKKEPAFIVAHYAGKVKYQITGFREKNKDLMRQDVLNALKSSTSSVMKTLLGIDPVAVHRWNVLRSVFRAMNAFKQSTRKLQKSESAGHLRVMDSIVTSPRRGSDSALSAFLRGELRCEVPDFCDTSMFNTIRNQARRTPAGKSDDKMSLLKSLQILKEAIGGRRLAKKPSSVSKQFEYSLTRLMSTLANATPYFIRCIKSNNDKIANHFDDNIILRQLRYTGMLETVRIRRAGYSVRIEYPSFVQQYRILLRNGRDSTVDDVKEYIHSHASIDNDNIQYGTNKIFMRDAEKLILDDHLHRTIMQSIDTLQRWFRTMLARKRYLRMKEGIIKIQALIRGSFARAEVRKKALAAQTIQCNWKKYKQRQKYLSIRESVIALQSAYRGASVRKRVGEIPKGNGALNVKKSPFRVRKVHAVNLTKFDLSDPSSLAAFALSDDDSDSDKSTQDGLDDDISEESDAFQDDDAVDVDATFILEDTKLKLIEGADLSHHRRQSLAPTASTTKLKMLRRANSTESNNFSMSRCDDSFTLSPTHSKKKGGAGKLGFQKAKKNLKALFGRNEDEDEPSPGPSFASELTPDVFVAKDHQFKMSRLHRQEICALCNRHLTNFISQAHKCQRCKMCLHKECFVFASSIPCNPTSPVRSPTRLHSPKRPWDLMPHKQRQSSSPIPSTGTFSLTKTKQQIDPGNMLVESTDDLRQFSIFIFNKTRHLNESNAKRDTVVDAVFKKSLRAFHMELLGYEAVLSVEQSVLKYRDVITMFEGLLTKVCLEESVSFPTTLGVNAFRGFLNEYVHVQSKKKRGKEKSSMIKVHAGHRFRAEAVHVPTYCEVCNQLIWHHEKLYTCVACRISCHKKCQPKVTHPCQMTGKAIDPKTNGGRFFGASLVSIVDDDHTVPTLLDRLFFAIETRALFVEGVYRKSGSLPQVRSIRKVIESTADADSVNLEDIGVHVLTTLVKAFFRELAEPIIIFDLYENFLNVSEVEDMGERVRCLSVMIELLPKPNRAVLDRLMYHLARVADQEAVNKMGCNNLALIFGPCVLRRQDSAHAQEQLNDVARQTGCVQTLIEEKLKQYKATIHNIVELEDASQKVSANLRKIEEHRRNSEPSKFSPNIGTAKQLFEEQLEFLGKQKERLLQELPPLAPVASSEDLSSSDENAIHASSSLSVEEYALDLDAPPVFCLLRYPTKLRPPGPAHRRRPDLDLRRKAFANSRGIVSFYSPV
ncbi:Unconventional myosin-IXa-like [Caenorhabditis elegans]|uniref:Unconventional myosin-IXa-like n=1 Tax=Caenorhabditis elegans TaxID=6239 RepID=H2L082_CAEEL|nr:Unconventional myosin-IXa-like [Caenorhabditis elegans]CCD71914.1 Unconventional myosin-IXa-like [Caenorhabditis elegans]|eukprot:NP_001248879.1 Heavy chain, Unconventional Myosin [Caenorhabditis elegans]